VDIPSCTAFGVRRTLGGQGGDFKKRLNEATATAACQNSANIEENIKPEFSLEVVL
jgi:hypothetical protein